MKKITLFIMALYTVQTIPVQATQNDSHKTQLSTWGLVTSAVSYKVTHPLKTAVGTTKAAKGKGNCDQKMCKFLIAVPVKTFDSGDSNRDLHMLEVTRGGTYPMIVVHATIPVASISDLNSGSSDKKNSIFADMEIEFAGQNAKYSGVKFDIEKKDENTLNVAGEFSIKLDDFKIDPPSLLTIAIKNEVPITVNSTWKKD